ncbi:restriction endonuclease subunit S [Shewanella algae]|uniref:restriction endonuclease subunit S n=1 Tax=Shewanella algae TaxID=38313 RepID=UPI001AAE3924|nr:restriction endonuclease subunit S [Shewanella algae]MBO2547360.1 restriction endonuclease subunit S [Shewanella algae]
MSGQAASYSKYIAYPEYRDSGVQWLPPFPQHWKVERVKRMLHLRRCLVGSRSAEYQLLSLTLRGIITRDISKGEGKIPESFETYQKVQKSDLVFCLFDMDETPRTVGLSDLDGMITGAYNVYGCLPRCFPGYAGYYFLHLDKFKGLRPFYTGLRKVVRAETFDNIDMPCPPIEEQRTIAAFLDYETARIDSLIDKQQRLIELLKEKRQAVISHAVTKGLNPDAPMKDSGVEWLGQVPEHWIVSSLKYVFQSLDAKRVPLSAEQRGHRQGRFPYYGASGIIDSVDDYIFDEDCVLVGEDGANLLARSTPLAFVATGKYWVNNHAHILRMVDGLNDYWAAVINNVDISTSVTGSAQPKLTAEALGNIQIAYPPSVEEREAIQDYLSGLTPSFEIAMNKGVRQVDLLQERRTALISAAVTGKIDLRGWTQPVKEDAA